MDGLCFSKVTVHRQYFRHGNYSTNNLNTPKSPLRALGRPAIEHMHILELLPKTTKFSN